MTNATNNEASIDAIWTVFEEDLQDGQLTTPWEVAFRTEAGAKAGIEEAMRELAESLDMDPSTFGALEWHSHGTGTGCGRRIWAYCEELEVRWTATGTELR